MPTMFHAKPSTKTKRKPARSAWRECPPMVAAPKPTDYSDRLRWGGSLVDPAWLTANNFNARGFSTVQAESIPSPEAMIEGAAKEALDEAFDPAYIRGEDGKFTYAEVDSVTAIENLLDAVLDEFKPEGHTEGERDALERRLSEPLRKAMLLMRSAAHDAVDRFFMSDKGGHLDMWELAKNQWHHHREGCLMETFDITPEDVCALVADSDHHTVLEIITQNQHRVS